MASQPTMPETKVDLSDQPHSQWQSSPQASIDLQQQLMLSSVSKPGVKRKTSPVWHVFRKCEPDKYGRNVECTATVILSSPGQPEGTAQCGKRYKVTEQTATTRASGTSGLREHIRQKHPSIYAQMISPTIPSFSPKHTRAHAAKDPTERGEPILGDAPQAQRPPQKHSSGGPLGGGSVVDNPGGSITPAARAILDHRYVLSCAIDMRPMNTASNDGFNMFIEGLNPWYAARKINGSTTNEILAGLCSKTDAVIAGILRRQRESCVLLGWEGPFVAVQADTTKASNAEYCTLSVSLVPEDFDHIVRLGISAKSFPGTSGVEDVQRWIREVTKSVFGDILREEQCEPRDVYLTATIDQSDTIFNAFKNLGVPTLVCTAHRLNSIATSSMGIVGGLDCDATGACKNTGMRNLVNRAMTMVDLVGHAPPVVKEEYHELRKGILDLYDDFERAIDLVRRNCTRWMGQYAVVSNRLVRAKTALMRYFEENPDSRALRDEEWETLRQAVSVLDPATEVMSRLQEGPGVFLGEAINLCSNLHACFAHEEQEVQAVECSGLPAATMPREELRQCVQEQLKILQEEVETKSLGHAREDVEILAMVFDPRFKTPCQSVCLNGGPALEIKTRAAVEMASLHFTGNVSATSATKEASGQSPREGTPGSSKRPLSRLERMRRSTLASRESVSKGVASPPGMVARSREVLREFGEYMLEPVSDSRGLLSYWKTKAAPVLDSATGGIVVPAKWPHVSLLARLCAGVDNTSCQAERNFLNLALTVSTLRYSHSEELIEKMMYLRLNKDLIPEFKRD